MERKKNILNQRLTYDKMVKEIYKPKISEILEEEVRNNKQRY